MPASRKTKTETVRASLARKQGASIRTLVRATGWQPHSIRAAISGLRKAGYEITRETSKGKADGSVYRITQEHETVE